MDIYTPALKQAEEIGDKRGMSFSLNNIGGAYYDKGDYDKALEYYERALTIQEGLGARYGIGASLCNIGWTYYDKGDYDKAEKYLEKSLSMQKEIGLGRDDLIWTTTYLYLTYKHLGRDYDVNAIHALIKGTEIIEFEINHRLYELLKDISYLETAYNQVQEKASAMEDEFKAKFLELPIPKAIVEEWEKVK